MSSTPNQIVHTGGSAITDLESPIGQRLLLQGLASPAQQANFIEWAPKDRAAIEVEFRAALVTTNCPGLNQPIIRYYVQLGHGDANYTEPARYVFVPTAPVSKYVLQGRGTCVRMAARQVRINFTIEGFVGPGPWNAPQNAEIQCSFMPVIGQARPLYPTQDFFNVALVPNALQSFPMTATEWQLGDVNGLPFAPAAKTVSLIGPNGFLHNYDAAAFATWQPIPWFAQTWTMGGLAPVNAQASYR